MVYNIFKVIGACIMIFAYFGGFLIFMTLGIYIADRIDIWKYEKKLELWEKYKNSVYNVDSSDHISHIM